MSITQSSQIKVTLPGQLYGFAKSKADKFGLTLSSYVKNLIIDDVKDVAVPTFKMSSKREKIALKALKEYKEGKVNEIENVEEYLNTL